MGFWTGRKSLLLTMSFLMSLLWLQKWKTRSAITRRGCLENGKKGLPDSSFPFTDTHAPSFDTDIGRFPAIVCWATTFITISPSVFDSPFAVQGRAWDNTANTEMVNLCKRAISSRTLSFSTATFPWTCGLQPQRTLRYRHRQGRSKGKVDVCGGP